MEAMAQIAKLKKQYTGGKEHAEKLAQANGGGNTVEKTKADLHTKKRSVSAKDQLIAERNEKKRALKLK